SKMTTWADIQRLATDLQRVQLANAAQKLSESNCIEVVTRLIERGVIDVVYTRDGSAYITRNHLCTMIVNEVSAAGGRLGVEAISANLNVHFDHVESSIPKINEEHGEYLYTNGELISREYVNQLHSQLRSLLSDCGLRTIAFLARHWDLASDTLLQLLTPLPQELGAVLDGDQIYTHSYMAAHKNGVRALFAATTKMTLLSTLITRSNLPSPRFHSLLDELIAEKEIAGRFSGSRHSPSALYVPNLHDRLVEAYVKNQIMQKEYIDLSMFRKLSLGEPKAALVQILGGVEKVKDLHILSTIVCTEAVLQRVKTILNDELSSKGVSDVFAVQTEIEIPFGVEDIQSIMKEMAKKDKKLTVEGDLIFSSSMISSALNEVKTSDRLNEKAREWVEKKLEKRGKEKKEEKESTPQPQGKKGNATAVVEDDDDWDDKKKGKGKKGGRGGGGEKGGTKGGGKPVNVTHKDKEREEERASMPHVSVDELEEWLVSVPEQLRAIVAEKIHYEVDSCLSLLTQQQLASREQEAVQSTKKAHGQMREKAIALYQRIRVFEEATHSELFEISLKSDLRSHLLKTLCSELSNDLLAFVSSSPSGITLTPKQRDDTISSLPSTSKNAFTALVNSLKEEPFEAFHEALNKVCSRSICDLPLNPIDKDTRDSIISSYTSLLKEEAASSVPAATLLSLILLQFTKQGVAVHASGKFVSQLLPCLKSKLDESSFDSMIDTQKLVIDSMRKKGAELEEINQSLNEKINGLREKYLK
ncbi:ufl-1, partial [Pristionchus pacificus]